MKHTISFIFFLYLFTLFTACSSDTVKEDNFPGATFVAQTDTLRMKPGESKQVKVFYGYGFTQYYNSAIVWESTNTNLVTVMNGGRVTAGDSCFTLCTITAKSKEGTTTVHVTFTLNNKIKTLSLNVSVSETVNIPTGGFLQTVNGAKFIMLPVEGGSFMMGATAKDSFVAEFAHINDEVPVHLVNLSDFFIGQTEVTQQVWFAVMQQNPSTFIGDLKNPVDRVSWNDCQQFISKLNELTGREYRLLTEAEWEYSARGGKKSKGYRFSGSDNLNDIAWYKNNSKNKDGVLSTHPVATKAPNELGIYDMCGNVREWCQDWYAADTYIKDSIKTPTDPVGPESSKSGRIIRGGNYRYDIIHMRLSKRSPTSENWIESGYGLRLAISRSKYK